VNSVALDVVGSRSLTCLLGSRRNVFQRAVEDRRILVVSLRFPELLVRLLDPSEVLGKGLVVQSPEYGLCTVFAEVELPFLQTCRYEISVCLTCKMDIRLTITLMRAMSM
jgi:hypothetical protein